MGFSLSVASVALLDTCLTGGQVVEHLIPARSGNNLSWRLILCVADSRRAFVSFWRKNVHKYTMYWLTA